MKTPNLFDVATSELSQDAFITWLIQWGNQLYSSQNENLCKLAQHFIRFLMNKPEDYIISTVEAGRQWSNIDIWAQVNDTDAIIIEDKTITKEHSNQLLRYKEIADKYYIPKNIKVHYIYLKTGNESIDNLKAIEDKGYRVISRKEIIDNLKAISVNSDIVSNFLCHLEDIENETNSYGSLQHISSSWRSCEGFYLDIQERLLPEWSGWDYVPNASGGFMGFWYHWNSSKKFPEIYIQIENSESEIKLVIKVSGPQITVDSLYEALPILKKLGAENDLIIEKPNRYRAGNTATLAIVKNAFDDSEFSVDGFFMILKRLEKVVDEFARAH